MAGKYKLDRASVDQPDAWTRRAAFKTLKSALIDIGRTARRDAAPPDHADLLQFFKPRYSNYRIILDGAVVFTVSGEDACKLTGDEQAITG